MKRFIPQVKAFTLVELLITVLLLAIIVMAIYSVLNIASAYYPIDMGLLDLQQQARQSMEWISNEARQSSSKAGKITITPVSADVDSITFTTPTKTGINYYLSGTQLLRVYPAGTAPRIIARDITRLKFTFINKILTIDLRAEKTVRKKPLSLEVKQKVRVRNED